MLEFQITGFDEFANLFEELETAFAQLNGSICGFSFDLSKPDQVQTAIQTTERAVDERLSEFPDNPLVQQLAIGTKEKFKAEILERASEARQKLAAGGIPFDPMNTSGILGGTPSAPLKSWSSARSTKRRNT